MCVTEEQTPPGGVAVPDEELDARWTNAWTPARVASRLADVGVPWWVAGGWALDLFRGEQSREHRDIEIVVPDPFFPQLREAFPEFEFDAVGDGLVWTDPSREALAATWQTWMRDPVTGQYLIDVMRNPHEDQLWVYRRRPELRMPYPQAIGHTTDGIPYLAPELVLLFKAKAARPKDQADFTAILPLLDSGQRNTLRELLTRFHPGHPWLAILGRQGVPATTTRLE